MESWEGDDVCLVVGFEGVEGVTDLFDLYGAGKGCLLGIIALKLEKACVRRFKLVG